MTGASDRAVVVAGGVVGLIAIVVGWYVAAGEATPGHQTAWISLAGAGLIVSGAANAAWLARARREVSRRRRVLLRAITVSTPPDPPISRLVAVRGGRFYHRSDCDLVAGKVLTRVRSLAGREPCGVCEP